MINDLEKCNALIRQVEESVNYNFPSDYKDFIVEVEKDYKQFRRNFPTKIFDLKTEKEKMLDAFLSVNPENKPNYIPSIKMYFSDDEEHLIPIVRCVFGDFVCYDKNTNNIVYYNHETRETEFIEKNLSEFIHKLYAIND